MLFYNIVATLLIETVWKEFFHLGFMPPSPLL